MKREQRRKSGRLGGGRVPATVWPVCGLLLGAGMLVSCGGGGGGESVTITVTVTPATHTLAPGATYTFTATVSGTTNTAVTWSVQEPNGGTITAAGLYTAPATEGTYHVRATSVADPTVTGSATVTVALASGQDAQLIDNRDAGFTVLSGDWGISDFSDGNGCWGPDFRYLAADRQNVGRARFTPALSAVARYAIYIYWSADPNRTTDQPVIVHDASGVDTTYHVNLQQHGNQWVFLGSHVMGPTGCYVEFNNDTDDGYCNADAVLLASPDAGVISGRVRNAQEEPIAGATVAVQGMALQATTNDWGQYTIPNVPAGSRTVVAAATDYASQSQSVNVVAASSATADFSLTPGLGSARRAARSGNGPSSPRRCSVRR